MESRPGRFVSIDPEEIKSLKLSSEHTLDIEDSCQSGTLRPAI